MRRRDKTAIVNASGGGVAGYRAYISSRPFRNTVFIRIFRNNHFTLLFQLCPPISNSYDLNYDVNYSSIRLPDYPIRMEEKQSNF